MNQIKVFTGAGTELDGAVKSAKTSLQEWIDETVSATNLWVRGVTVATDPFIFQTIVLYDDPNAEAVDDEEPLLPDGVSIDDDWDLEAILMELDKT